jgi:hypothetical protein
MAYYKKFDYEIQNLIKVGFNFGLVVKKVGAFFTVVVTVVAERSRELTIVA